MKINIDADEWVIYTNKLEKLPKSALPNAVRGTLNGLAFDVKKNTMPESAEKTFINRQRNFFKANSRVEMARGSNITTMKSTVGFISLGGTNTAVEDLEKQEKGGVVPGRAFIPTNLARVSKSKRRNVARRHRISGIKNIVRVDNVSGNSENQKFVKAVIEAGKGGHVLRGNMLFFVNSLKRTGSNWKFRLTAIHSFKKGRKARIAKATHFMEKAVDKTVKKADDIYFKEAERQFLKHMQ